MPELRIETPEGVDLRYELAGPGSRSAAFLIDLAIFSAGALLALLILALSAGIDPTGVGLTLAAGLGVGLLLLHSAYHWLFGLLSDGQTPGKRLVGIRVTGSNGYPASAFQHFVRALFLGIEALATSGLVGLSCMLATPLGQRLGDLVAGTVVLRLPRAAAGLEPFAGESWSGLALRSLPLVPAHAARLDQADLAFLRRLLVRRDLDPAARRRLYVRTATHYAERLELGSFRDARDVLRELFLFVREFRGMRAE